MNTNDFLLAIKLLLGVFVLLLLLLFLIFLLLLLQLPVSIPEGFEVVFVKENNLILPISATIVTSIVAIALPLSIQLVTSSTRDSFNEGEVGELIFQNIRYTNLKRGLILMATIILFSWVGSNLLIDGILVVFMFVFLWAFYKYISFLQDHISDFGGRLIENEKNKIKHFLND
tara:strand:+ start:336 stop:854 length:519 start_codon:yes stop_codon:yes gene_type:complete